jgi:protein SCO1/2
MEDAMLPPVALLLLLLQDPGTVLTQIGIDQQLNAKIDGAIVFKDESGEDVPLSSYLGRKPVIVTPVYYECPMLCSMALNGLVKSLRAVPFEPGRDFEIVTFSIDPNETSDLARAKKEQYIRAYGRDQARQAWHFLTGSREAIAKLTQEMGFRYTYDSYTKQWAHPSVMIILTGGGRISRYFNGIDYDPAALRLSLVEASHGSVGSLTDNIILSCFHYDPTTGRYDLAILRGLRIAGAATALAILAFVFGWQTKWLHRRPSRGTVR